MKRPTYAELTAERDRLSRDTSLLSIALNCVMREKPLATEIVRFGRQKYTLRLYGADRGEGGIVTWTHSIRGQKIYTLARYLEDCDREFQHACTEEGLALRAAINRLFVARNNALQPVAA